jgi:cytidine deaminase
LLASIAAMLTDGHSGIRYIVAVNTKGKIYPPCGRCRELIYQVDKRNLSTEIILSETETALLSELLPMRWQESI